MLRSPSDAHEPGRRKEDTMMSMHKSVVIALGGVLVGALGATLLQAQTPKPGPGFVIAEFAVKDQDAYREYGQRAPGTIAQYGGKFMVRGGKVEALKGDAPKGPFVVLAFDSAEQAKKWATSSEYSELAPIRDKGADFKAFIVEGVAPSP